MSRKRPTESSWDSDDDLLRDDLPGITAFAKTKSKEDSDDEVDEDALLGSDDENNDTSTNVKPKLDTTCTTEISILNTTETFDESDKSFGQDNPDDLTAEQDTLETFEIAVEDEELEEFGGEDFEAQEAEIRQLAEDVSLSEEQSTVTDQTLDDSQTEDQSYQDDNEAEEVNKSVNEKDDSESSSESDDDDDDDDDKSNRGRFKSERSSSIVIKSSSISRTNIPDTLEITEEQQAQIDDFMDNQGKRNRNRGRGGRRGGRYPDRQNNPGPPFNQHPGPPQHDGPFRFGDPRQRPPPPQLLNRFQRPGPYAEHVPPERYPSPQKPPHQQQSGGYQSTHGYELRHEQTILPEHHIPPDHHLPPDHHIQTDDDVIPPDHHLPPDYALESPPSPASMDTQTSLSTASHQEPRQSTPRKILVNPHFKPKGPPPAVSLAWSTSTSVVPTAPTQTVLPGSQPSSHHPSYPTLQSWPPQHPPAAIPTSASYPRPGLLHADPHRPLLRHTPQPLYHDPNRGPHHSGAPVPSLMARPSYPPAHQPYPQSQSLLGPGPPPHQGAVMLTSGPPPAGHIRPLLTTPRPQIAPQYHHHHQPPQRLPGPVLNRFPPHRPQQHPPSQQYHQPPRQEVISQGNFHPRQNLQPNSGRGRGRGGPVQTPPPKPDPVNPQLQSSPLPGQKRLSTSTPPEAAVPEKVAKPEESTKPEEPVDEETRLLNEKIAEQKKLREKLIKQKEMKRRLAAAQKKKDLEKRLAEKGMTLADIGADSTESETDTSQSSKQSSKTNHQPKQDQQHEPVQNQQQLHHSSSQNLRHPRPPFMNQQRQINPHQHQEQLRMRPPHLLPNNRMDHPHPQPGNNFQHRPNFQNQQSDLRMRHHGPPGPRMAPPIPLGFSSFQNPTNPNNFVNPQPHEFRPHHPQNARHPLSGNAGQNNSQQFINTNNFQDPPESNKGRGNIAHRGNFNRGNVIGREHITNRGNLANRGQGPMNRGNMRGHNRGRGLVTNRGNVANRGGVTNRGNMSRGRGMGAVKPGNQQQSNLQQVNIVDTSSNRQVLLQEKTAEQQPDRIVTQQPQRIVTQSSKQLMANQMKRLATKSLAKATNIISLRKVKVGGTKNEASPAAPNRVVVPASRTVITESKKSQLVCVDNLSATTTKNQIANLCHNVGPVDSIKIDPCTKKALIKFQNADHAVLFSKKFNRHMIDLSHITVSLVPG